MRKFFLSAICALIAVSSALASGLTASHTVEKEVVVQTEDGTTEIKYVSADRIAPGEKVLYSLNVANDGAQAATNLVLVMPVPDEVQFITGSAKKTGSTVSYSVDGGQSFSPWAELSVKQPDGRSKSASADDVTHIRWDLAGPIEPGTTDVLSFKGTLK